MYKTIKIESFAHFIELLEKDTQFDLANRLEGVTLYRGQNCDLPLLPKIERSNKTISEILDIEAILLNEFEKRCQPFLDFEIDNDWDLLACAQHYGLPTRLLDWTENPLVALWFAVSLGSQDNSNSVVWIFDVENEDLVDDFGQNPLEIKNTLVFDPRHINKRITSQSGWFTVHRITDSSKKMILPLEKNSAYRNGLVKLLIPHRMSGDFLNKLNKLGINQATVFADLDGLCKHLEWMFFCERDEFIDRVK